MRAGQSGSLLSSLITHSVNTCAWSGCAHVDLVDFMKGDSQW